VEIKSSRLFSPTSKVCPVSDPRLYVTKPSWQSIVHRSLNSVHQGVAPVCDYRQSPVSFRLTIPLELMRRMSLNRTEVPACYGCKSATGDPDQYVVAGRDELGFAMNDERKNHKSHRSQRKGLTNRIDRIRSMIPVRLD
jgi:hypothetical protein